jgi:DNA ligase (NAD+)
MTGYTSFACIRKIFLIFSWAVVLLDFSTGTIRATSASAALTNLADPAERIRFLRAEIARHDELYYRKAEPEISDSDYDLLKNELTALNEQFPEEAAKLGPLPVGAVGDDRTPGFAPSRHRARMQSLDNTYSEAGLREF